MLGIHVEFFEGVVIEQERDALAGGQLATLVLGIDPLLASAGPCIRAPSLQFLYDVFHCTHPNRQKEMMVNSMTP